jgi:hypothetical protein
MSDDKVMRSFDTGATRDTAEGKLDYEGFLSPAVLKQYAKYMNMNRLQSDGQTRDSDNWQKGIPQDEYMKSGYRHFYEWWAGHRYGDSPMIDRKPTMAALCGLLFNIMGYMHEELKRHPEVDFDGDEPTPEMKKRQDTLKLYEDPDMLYPQEMKEYETFCGTRNVTDKCETCNVGLNECQLAGLKPTPTPTSEKQKKREQLVKEFLNMTCGPVEVEFLDTDVPENFARLTELQDEDEGTEQCSRCLHWEKLWDEWPCRRCQVNDVDVLEQGPFKHSYFCSREGLDAE